MDQATRFLLLSTLVPALMGGVVAVWTLWVSRRQREREADRRDLMDRIEQTKRSVSAGIRFLTRTSQRRKIEDVELLLRHDAYPKANLLLIGDAQALNTYLGFEASVLAYAAVHEPFNDDLLTAGRMVEAEVLGALDHEYECARTGKRLTMLTPVEQMMTDPHELWLRRQAYDEQVASELEARRQAIEYADGERRAGRSALAPSVTKLTGPEEAPA